MWVARICELVGRFEPTLMMERAQIEGQLETPLPNEYFELAARFGEGRFCEAIYLYDAGVNRPSDLLTMWRYLWALYGRSGAEGDGILAPYPIYEPGEEGLIPWGGSDEGDWYFWHVTRGVRPSSWPILVRTAEGTDETPPSGMFQFDMSTAEFLWRLLADPEFAPLGIARAVNEVWFESDTSHDV